MKRLMTLMLALTLVVGGAAVVLAQDLPGQDRESTKKRNKKKKKSEQPKKTAEYLEASAPNYAG